MTKHYSAIANAFFDEAHFGPRQIEVVTDGVTSMQPNPDCRIPRDAVEISAEEHAELVDAMSKGHVIEAGENGRPRAVPRPGPKPAEHLAMLRKIRDARLRESDWTQVADAPVSKSKAEAWRAYRKALRDLPKAFEDPASDPSKVQWPAPPR